jgi:plasmid stability protein
VVALTPKWNRHGSAVATITAKNIPADLHRELKKRAEEHHRSLNKDIIATLKSATGGNIRLDPIKLEESVRQARALFRRSVTAREIDRWKREGRL